jgi:Domain of unknown function (DUF6933)
MAPMFTLRCTLKLRKRLRLPPLPDTSEPSTALGDWYANIIYVQRRPLIFCVSERSLLPVLVAARDLPNLPQRFERSVRYLLERLDIPGPFIDKELAEMGNLAFGPTRSRSVLSSMNDFVNSIHIIAEHYQEWSLSEMEDELYITPCGPLGYDNPAERTRKLLGEAYGS